VVVGGNAARQSATARQVMLCAAFYVQVTRAARRVLRFCKHVAAIMLLLFPSLRQQVAFTQEGYVLHYRAPCYIR